MTNLQMCMKNLEIHRSAEMVEGEANPEQSSESAGVFKSIQGVNRLFKEAMKDEMKSQGLSDADIRYVLNMDHN